MADRQIDSDHIKELINEHNRRMMLNDLSADEIMQIRMFFRKDGPADQLNEALESYRGAKRIGKVISVLILSVPAVLALWQSLIKWMRGQ